MPLNSPLPDLRGDHWTKPVPPETHGLVADINATLEQQIFDLPQRERITNVHHHREADDLRLTVKITEATSHCRRLRNVTNRLKRIYSDNALSPNTSPLSGPGVRSMAPDHRCRLTLLELSRYSVTLCLTRQRRNWCSQRSRLNEALGSTNRYEPRGFQMRLNSDPAIGPPNHTSPAGRQANSGAVAAGWHRNRALRLPALQHRRVRTTPGRTNASDPGLTLGSAAPRR